MDKANIYEDLVAVWAAEGRENKGPTFPAPGSETAAGTPPRRDGKDHDFDPSRD